MDTPKFLSISHLGWASWLLEELFLNSAPGKPKIHTSSDADEAKGIHPYYLPKAIMENQKAARNYQKHCLLFCILPMPIPIPTMQYFYDSHIHSIHIQTQTDTHPHTHTFVNDTM